MSEKEDENTVDGPSFSVTQPEKKIEKDTKRSIEEERYGVLLVSHKIGAFFSVSMIVSGIILFLLSIFQLITHANLLSENIMLILIVYVFVSIVNSVGGLLLIGTY
ncbi:MAG: hypothetical protein PVF96_04970 [Candidatus Bathyarchaeota archaeon]|jgi:hypothetical protein